MAQRRNLDEPQARELPTAVGLGGFRRDLLAEGFPAELTDEIVRFAARELLASGPLIVKSAAGDGSCTLCGLPADACRAAQEQEFIGG